MDQKALELIGLVGCNCINRLLKRGEEEAGAGSVADLEVGIARLAFHRLSPEEVAAITRGVIQDPMLKDRVEILLPRYKICGIAGIPEEILTEKSITELRHSKCTKEALLLALFDDSQEQGMGQVTKINKDLLIDPKEAGLWVEEATKGMALPESVKLQWTNALKGLFQLDRLSLQDVACYICETRDLIDKDGMSARKALGAALWVIRIPSFASLFDTIPDQKLTAPSAWKAKYQSHWNNECYLQKRNKSQAPYTKRALLESLEKSREQLAPHARETLEKYVEAGDGWTEASEALAKVDWAEAQPFFESVGKPEAMTIGQLTKAYFDLKDPELLDKEDQNYVKGLVERGKKPVKEEEDTAFYLKHQAEMQKDDPTLATMWERFVFGSEVCCSDFRIGILECLQRLLKERGRIAGGVIVEVTGDENEQIKFRQKNEFACRFFQKQYSGLEKQLEGLVEFRKVLAFSYEKIHEKLEEADKFKGDSISKKALQLGFRVLLKSKTNDEERTLSLRLVWGFEIASVMTGYAADLDRMTAFVEKRKKAPLIRCRGTREAENISAGYLSLHDVAGFSPTGTRERGQFIPPITRCEYLGKEWNEGLAAMEAKEYIDAQKASKLAGLFEQFCESYTNAVGELASGNVHSNHLFVQAQKYAELVETICLEIKADEARRRLLRPLLEIGVASIGGTGHSDPATVTCPWQPIRMQAIAASSIRYAQTVRRLLCEQIISFTDAGETFFHEEKEYINASGGPEIVVHWRGTEPTILSFSDGLHGYSLHESPVSKPDSVGTNENAGDTAKIIAGIVDSYLTLQPHERDNFSIVLYNCDSVPLPQAVVKAIRAASESDSEAMCQVVLTHSVRSRLQELYEQIARQEGDDDAFHVSENSRDFMARVRINIMVEEAPASGENGGKPADIVFCQDVISRHAELGWEKANRIDFTVSPEALVPHQWSRRRELQRGERKSVVYLTCPAQTKESWVYHLALSVLDDTETALDSWSRGACRLPARKLDFDRQETSKVFQQTHALGTWVVNLDPLLDRRLLRDRDIKVIRYKHTAAQGRNLIISSTASNELLKATLTNKLRELTRPDITDKELNNLCERFINEANDISGHLVLRAAKRGNSTNELIGLVLSRFMIQQELGADRETACFLLDDYANWFGQAEERMADLLVLAPKVDESGNNILDIVVGESKFISFPNLADMANKSGRQLRDTLKRIESALFGDPTPADHDIWLARLSDLLLEGLQKGNGTEGIDVPRWRATIRRRECRISVRGYSHVFVHTPIQNENDGDRYHRVKDTQEGHQECFSRSTVKAVIAAFEKNAVSVNELRAQLSGCSFTKREYKEVIVTTRALPVLEAPQKEPAPKPTPTETTKDGSLLELAKAQEQNPNGGNSVTMVTTPTETQKALLIPADLEWLESIANRTKVALQKREMTAKLLEKRLTPNAALLKFQGTDDLTIGRLEPKLTELKTTDGLEIIALRPEVGKIAISIARPKRQILNLREVWKRWTPNCEKGNTELLIGVKEEDNELLFLSPDPQPHTLVAGETGSGKSVLIQSILLAIASTNTSDQARIQIIDPKLGVDYFAFSQLPHLIGPLISDKEKALEFLQGLVAEMTDRYRTFQAAQTPNLATYMAKTGKVLPRIWVIHDEFALWMQEDDYRRNVDSLVNQLSVAARAAGIYLIFAAQRPDNTVFPMQLRSNLGNRLVLKVDTEGTSEIALGIKKGGAERLLGHGHLAAKIGGKSDIVPAQVPFIDSEDICEMVNEIRAKYETQP